MKVIKKINNNVAVGVDGNQREVIIFGKGIGFNVMPYELNDMSKVDRTYYDIEQKYYGLLKEIPEETFTLISKMVEIIKGKVEGKINPNLIFVLADHINFAVTRSKKGMNVVLPYSYELEYEYPQLTKIAIWFVKVINEKMDVVLPKGEVTSVTMHLINALEGSKEQGADEDVSVKTSRVIKNVTNIVESYFKITLDKNNFNYFRFKNHLKYFVQRKERKEEFHEGNEELYQGVKKAYPDTDECVAMIDEYLYKEFNEGSTQEELLYLMVHVNRLYTKEDCNRKGITPN